MDRFTPHLDWLDAQQDQMVHRLVRWAQINSGSHNLAGLATMSTLLADELRGLGADVRTVDLPPQLTLDDHGEPRQRPLGQLLWATRHAAAPLRVFLGIHCDTVYGPEHPFQHAAEVTIDGRRCLRGPGVADAKGGLVVMLAALSALARSPWADMLGWEVMINPDEELGSPGSAALLAEAARRNHLGLLYEPAREDGSLVDARKGSGNYTAIFTGRAAHAGRDPHFGRNAIHAMAAFVTSLATLAERAPGITVNVGHVAGGGPVNVVPDRATCRFNVRVDTPGEQHAVEAQLAQWVVAQNAQEGHGLRLAGGFHCPPKPLDDGTRRLLAHVIDCGRDLGMELTSRPSGGVSDGNKLAAAGLVNVDTLGVCGGRLHSADEYMVIDSLARRAKLSALLLLRLASGDVRWRSGQ